MKQKTEKTTINLSGSITVEAQTPEEAKYRVYSILEMIIEDAWNINGIEVNLECVSQGVIWGMTSNRKGLTQVHAYLSEKDLEEGKCLCGSKCHSSLRMPNWKPEGDEIADTQTCSRCRAMLPYTQFQ